MSDLAAGAVSNGRTQNGGSRAAGPVPQNAGGDRVRRPTDIMRQRRDREARKKKEREREEERRRAEDRENIDPDRISGTAGVGPSVGRSSYRGSKEGQDPRRTSAEVRAQASAVERRPGDRGSGGSTRAQLSSANQPIVNAYTISRTQKVSTNPRDNAADISVQLPRSRPRGATLSTAQSRPVEAKPTQAPRAVSSAAGGGASTEVNFPQTRQGSDIQRGEKRPGTGATTGEPQTTRESAAASQQRSTNTSSFPHAFERWEQLSSHWEGLTGFWMRRLEQNKEDLDREPLNQQMARQVTDLSAAGANLFHAVVELQRLRASSERKFQRWFFETRADQERARETQKQLEKQVESLRQAHSDTAVNSARAENEIKAAYVARSMADVQVKEMKRELSISKEEARRAWEELGRREQEERGRTTSLKNGEPTLVGGVQVVPMVQGGSRQGSTNRPSTRDGGGHATAAIESARSPLEDESGYTTYDPARSETDTDPFTEEGRTNRSQPDSSVNQPHQRTANNSTAAVQAARAVTHQSPQHINAQQSRTTTTTTTTIGGNTYLNYRPEPSAASTAQPPTSSFYQHEGTSLQPTTHQPQRITSPSSRSFVPSIEDTFSDEDYDLDSNGEVRRDATGRPILAPRHLGSEASSDEYDVHEALERERMYGRSYGSGIPGVEYGSGSREGQRRGGGVAGFGTGELRSAQQSDYDGNNFGTGWEAMPRHHHPTRLSDVLEEDERSRNSPSRASQNSRGIR